MSKLTSIALPILATALFIGFIFGLTALAIGVRKLIGRTRLSTWLIRRGFSFDTGSIYELKKGRRYVIKRSFVDYHQQRFEVGEQLTFLSYDYLPYHSGHTLTFAERKLYLQEEEQAEIVRSIRSYLEPV